MIVLDANILIRAVLGQRVGQLLDHYSQQGIQFYAPETAYAEAEEYLPTLFRKKGKPDTWHGAGRIVFEQASSDCGGRHPKIPLRRAFVPC